MPGTIDEVALYGSALSSARVQAHYAAGTSGPPDAVPAPSGLTATASPGTIDLTWTDNAANETGFTVQRDSDPGFPAPTSTSLPANTTTFSDTGLPVGRRYYYRVSARNATDTSGWSNVASATTPDPVAAPSGLAANAVSPTRVDLQWLDNSTNETGVSVERSASSTFTSPTVTALPANATTYSDTSVSGSQTYYYRVRATNATNASPYSNTATATTPAPPLTAPTGLTATAASQTQVDLRWTDTTSTETGFVVERDSSSSFTAPTARTVAANATTFSDTGLAASTTYYYRVRATNATQASPNSNTASATTLTTPPPPSSYVTTVRADSPVSHWRLSETAGTAAADQMAANPGLYVNAPMLGQASLLGADTANPAAGFDGSVDHVKVADSASLKLTSPFSLELWLKPTAIPAAGSFASVLTKENTFSLQFNGPRLEFTVIQAGTRKRLQAAAGAVVAGLAYHVVATYDGATRRLYLNGVEVVNGPLTGAATSTANPLMIASWDGRAEFFRGTVDEVAVYKTALAPARVTAHYNAGK
jgi:hypothetical protein